MAHIEGILNRLGLFTANQHETAFREGELEGVEKAFYGISVTGSPSDPLAFFSLGRFGMNPDRVLRNEAGANGLDYYRDLREKDQTIQTVVRRRIDRVLALDRRIVPASGPNGPTPEQERHAEFTRHWMARFDKLKRTWEDIMEADYLGYSVNESLWEDNIWQGKRVFIPFAAPKRDQNFFSFDITTNQLLYSPTMNFTARAAAMNVDELFPGKFLRFSLGPTNNPWGEALARGLHSAAWVKRKMAPGELVALDRMAFGTLIAFVKGGGSPNEKEERAKTVLEVLKKVQTANAAAIPEDLAEKIQYLESAIAKGTETMWERKGKRLDIDITRAALGQTLTTGEGEHGGNRALGGIHLGGEDMLIVRLVEAFDEMWSDGLIRTAVIMNFGAQDAYPMQQSNTDMIKSSAAELEEDKGLQEMGFPISVGYLAKKYDRPLPEGTDPEALAAPASAPATVPGPEFAEHDEPPHRRAARIQLAEYEATIEKALLESAKLKGKQGNAVAAMLSGATTPDMVLSLLAESSEDRVEELTDLVAQTIMLFQMMGRSHTRESVPESEQTETLGFAEPVTLTAAQIAETPYGRLLEIFQERAAVTDEAFEALTQAARQETFSFAGAQDARTVARVQEALRNTLARGGTLSEFTAGVGDVWSSSAFHLETVFATNVQQAYTDGVDAQFEEFGPEEFPLAELVTVGDADVRDEHQIWDGFIARPDDPVWKQMNPLNSHRCRCQKVLIHRLTVEEENIRPTSDAKRNALLRKAPADPSFR